MSTVDPDHGNGEPSSAWGDDVPSDPEEDDSSTSSDEDSSIDDSDGDLMETEELKSERADIGKYEYAPRLDDDSSTKSLDNDQTEIDENGPTGTAEPLTFLTVPGEIRNLIYSFMTDAAKIHPYELKIAKPKEPGLSPAIKLDIWNGRITFRKPLSECKDWSLLKREFLGLAQVNRQLREEVVNFTDGYAYHVYFSQLEAYANDFFVNSIRNIRQLSWTRIHFLPNDSVDVKDLALFLARLPGYLGMHYRHNLPGWLLGTKISAEWLIYLEQCVSRVVVRASNDVRTNDVLGPSPISVKVGIYVYEDHAEDWMWKWKRLVQQDAWLEKYGLLHPNRVRVAVSVDRGIRSGIHTKGKPLVNGS
ncbi:hypothetical protein G6514_009319 [Epicoccum nigrum]|nr:hypothetical protein G6514_009319 [Epicoccum nigrum]